MIHRSHPCKSLLKTILKDRTFDVKIFVASGFGEFLRQTRDYLQVFKEKTKVKKGKTPNCHKIIAAFEKLFPVVTRQSFKNDFVDNLSAIFAVLLHPNSPESYRKKSLGLFLDLLPIFDSGDLPSLEPVFDCIVPWMRFARNPEEIMQLRELVRDRFPVIDPDEDQGSPEDVCMMLVDVLKFLNSNWSTKTDMCCKIFLKHILCVVFNAESIKCGFDIPRNGFQEPVPTLIVHIILSFFQNFMELDNDLSVLVRDKRVIGILVDMLGAHAANQTTKRDTCVTSLNLVTAIMREIGDMETFMKENNEILYSMINMLANIFNNHCSADDSLDPTESAILYAVAECFAHSFYEMMPKTGIKDFYVTMFRRINHSYVGLGFMYVYFLNDILSSDSSPEQWETLRLIQAENEVLASHGGIYGEYLALHSFITVYKVDIQNFKEVCESHVRRKLRVHSTEAYNWTAENWEDLVERPHICMNEKFQFNTDFKVFFPMPEVKNPTLLQNIDRFVNTFSGADKSCYATFLPVISYYYALVQIAFPPDLKIDESNVTIEMFDHLIKANLESDDMKMRKDAFTVLSMLINRRSSKQFLKDEQMMLWYTAVITMMLSTDTEVRDLACAQALQAVMIGHRSASMLVAFILRFINDEVIKLDCDNFGFMCSLPLFESAAKIPWKVIDRIKKLMMRTPDAYIPDALEYLSDKEIPHDIGTVLNNPSTIATQVVLGYELLKKKPAPEIIKRCLDRFIELDSISSVFPFCKMLSRTQPTEALEFLTRAIDLAEKNKDLLSDAAMLAIHTFEANTNHKQYSRLVEILRTEGRTNDLSMLAVFYGNCLISSCDTTIAHSRIFSSGSETLFAVKDDELSVVKSSMKRVWGFQPVTSLLTQQKQVPEVSFDATVTAKTVRNPDQIKFSTMFDQICEKTTTRPLNLRKDGPLPEAQVINRERKQDTPTPSPITSNPAAFLNSLGMTSTDFVGFMSMENDQRKLDTLKHTRRQVKAVILYESDSTNVYKMTLDEASSYFREFVYSLGLVKRKDHSMFYMDLKHELQLSVPAMMDDTESARRCAVTAPVAIIWSDRSSDVGAIQSQINVITIVIYPLKTGLLSVNIVPNRGLLSDIDIPFKRIIVTKVILPTVVRCICAKCADSIARHRSSIEKPPREEAVMTAGNGSMVDIMSCT